MLFNKRREVRTPRLLLTLDYELHVDRQTAFRFNIRLYRKYLGHDLPLVVLCTTGIDPAVPDCGFEWRAYPLFHWFGRLTIVLSCLNTSNNSAIYVSLFSSMILLNSMKFPPHISAFIIFHHFYDPFCCIRHIFI